MTPDELKAWRESRSLTQSQLAQKLGVAVSTVQRWEYGERPIPPYLELALRELDRKKGKRK